MMTSKGPPELAIHSAALLAPWRRIAQQLCPLIGDSGFCALFGRACHVVGPDYAWLVPEQPCRAPEPMLAALEERMALADAAHAAIANDALLRTFTQLLAALIGDALTGRLLASASTTAHEQNNALEQK